MINNRISNFFQNVESKKWKSFVFWFLSFFVLSILLRLPHFLSQNFWFDGDEAMIGIMAQDFLAGESFPLYFYGQAYGFSLFEVLSVAFWIKLVGTGIWALRLGGLTLFALGAFFIFKGLIQRNSTVLTSFLIVLAVLSFPTWSLWGAMVRGGYVTGFTAVSALFYLTAKIRFTIPHYIIAGALLAIAFESHFLLLVPVLPLILMEWVHQNGKWKGLAVTALFAIFFVVLCKSLNFYETYWTTPKMNWDVHEYPNRLMWYVKGFLNAYSNFFYFKADLEIPKVWKILLISSLLLIGFLMIHLFLAVNKRKKMFIGLTFLGMLFIAFFSVTILNYSPRYFISFFSALLFLFLFFSQEILSKGLSKKAAMGVLMIYLIGTSVGSFQRRDWIQTTVNKMNAFSDLHKVVVERQIKALFVCDNLMQWQWNYLYGREIPANGFRAVERTMSFTHAVDSIYRVTPKRTGIIGYWGLFYGIDFIDGFNDTREQIATDFFLQPEVLPEFHDHGYEQMGEPYKE